MQIGHIVLLLGFLLTHSELNSQKKSRFLINDEKFELFGKWEQKGYNKSSGQFVFKNERDTITLSISVREAKYFEFYNDTLSQEELLTKYYQWDADYWSKSGGLNAEVKKIKSFPNYILWSLTLKNLPDNDNKDLVSYIVYFIRNDKLISKNINYGRKIDLVKEEEAVSYLERLMN
jgi:hypothetical protein